MTLHDAILILNHMNDLNVDCVKFPSGKLITRMDCEDVIENREPITIEQVRG